MSSFPCDSPAAATFFLQLVAVSAGARTAGPRGPPGTIRAGAVCAQAGNPRGKVPSWSLEEQRNVGGPLPATGTQDVRMKLEPSSRCESASSSPTSIPSSLLQTHSSSSITPSARSSVAAASSPRGGHPREVCTGQMRAQGVCGWMPAGLGVGQLQSLQKVSIWGDPNPRSPTLNPGGSWRICSGVRVGSRRAARSRGVCPAARGHRGWVVLPPTCPQHSWLALSHARLQLLPPPRNVNGAEAESPPWRLPASTHRG